jgi:caffeoyl-CoA O-methyltransferase
VESLRSLPEEEIFDFAFVDADKSNCVFYYREILKRPQPNLLIAFDNILFRGRVLDPGDRSEQAEAIRRLNELLTTDRRVETVMLHVSDGLTLVRKF